MNSFTGMQSDPGATDGSFESPLIDGCGHIWIYSATVLN
jgi:hypothetical protein